MGEIRLQSSRVTSAISFGETCLDEGGRRVPRCSRRNRAALQWTSCAEVESPSQAPTSPVWSPSRSLRSRRSQPASSNPHSIPIQFGFFQPSSAQLHPQRKLPRPSDSSIPQHLHWVTSRLEAEKPSVNEGRAILRGIAKAGLGRQARRWVWRLRRNESGGGGYARLVRMRGRAEGRMWGLRQYMRGVQRRMG